MPRIKKRPYKCKHCNKTVKRASTKTWVGSYCSSTGRTVHLQLVK